MKKTIATITAVFLVIVLSSVPARADRKTMEGFLIGTGVAILGTAIFNEIHKDKHNSVQYQTTYNNHKPYYYSKYDHRDRHRPYKKYKKHRPRGHWEVERVWIEPVYEKKWNPGHYNRRGKWVSGRYERFLVCEGYWKQEKVWVRY